MTQCLKFPWKWSEKKVSGQMNEMGKLLLIEEAQCWVHGASAFSLFGGMLEMLPNNVFLKYTVAVSTYPLQVRLMSSRSWGYCSRMKDSLPLMASPMNATGKTLGRQNCFHILKSFFSPSKPGKALVVVFSFGHITLFCDSLMRQSKWNSICCSGCSDTIKRPLKASLIY